MRRLLWVAVAAVLAAPALSGEPRLDARQGSDGAGLAIRQLFDQGKYEAAEHSAAESYAQIQKSYGNESIELARASDLLVDALLRNGRNIAPNLLDIATQAIRIKEQRLGTDHVEVAESLHGLGAVHFARGEFVEALSLHERALALRLRHLQDDDSSIADSLDFVARTLLAVRRSEPVQGALTRSLRIREAHASEAPLALARTLELVGRAAQWAGRYGESATALDRALGLWEKTAPRHPDTVPLLTARGLVASLGGEVPAAFKLWVEAVRLARETLRPGHPLIAWANRNLAMGQDARADIGEARRLREEGVEIAERSISPCDPEFAYQLNDLGLSRMDAGDFVGGRALYRRVESIATKCLGPVNDTTATAVINQFDAAREMGAFAEAERLGNRAIKLWSQALGPNHPFVAYGAYQLAAFEATRKRYARARELFEQSLRIRRQALGVKHPDLALTLIPYAGMLAEMGRSADARSTLNEALAILHEAPARYAYATAQALEVRALLETQQGDYNAARTTLTEAVAEKQRIYGADHPHVATTRAQLASTDLVLGQYDDALTRALGAEQAGRDALRFTMRSLPERQAMEFASKRPRGLDLALSIAASDHADAATILDAVIQSRGIVLDELAARTRAASSGELALNTLNATLTAARARYASLMLRSVQGNSVDEALLIEARRHKEDAEEVLAQQSAATRAELTRARAGLADVRSALPDRSALVSFVRYDRSIATTKGPRTSVRVVPSYVAFVSRSDREDIATVPLGAAAALDGAVGKWRAEVNGHTIAAAAPAVDATPRVDPERAYRVAGAPLRSRVWDPIAPHLQGIDRVFIVPDGAINTVSFAALPIGSRQYLIESAPVIHYLTTERDLLAGSTGSTGSGLLAVGGPTYGQPAATSTAAVSASNGGAPLVFEDLPGTKTEVEDIARLWGTTQSMSGHAPSTTTILSGRAASKTAVMKAASGRRVVHLATHGFFLGSARAPTPANTRGVGGLVKVQSKTDENPLLLSGLAFAGANQRVTRAGADNGILTAEEIVALNLQGTEWAVLSACDTGLGQIRAGEGVFGLRRAFQIAGVRTVITSLWSVEDQTTRLWMRTLYEARLRQNLSTAEAVRAAGLRVLRDRRAGGQSAHPFYWAAFVAAGDWR